MKITVVQYLISKLSKLGVRDIFGLPGDFNFNILDVIEESSDVNWVNSINELNAGYSADGYARINGFGAVVTTFGVGELSALNAVAGSYSEGVPVMKIAGIPSTTMIDNKVLLHHSFQNADYYAYERIYSNVVETTAFLNKDNAKAEIDRIVDVMLKRRKPVYVAIPVDVCLVEIDVEIENINLISDSTNLDNAIKHITSVVNSSERPTIIADFPVKRYKLEAQLEKLVIATKFPVASLLMSKGVIDETNESYMGTYLGNLSLGNTETIIKESDCVITLGMLFSDLNTGGFSIKKTEAFRVDIQTDYVIVDGVRYENVWMKDILEKLSYTLKVNAHSIIKDFAYPEVNVEENKKLNLNYIFPRLQEFLREDDMLFVETGIISFSSGMMKLPKKCSYNNQMLWGSIGWATPALFGAAMANKSRRPVLFTGEGSHQLTVQEVANMLHYNIKPVIIVLNNSGYTIERILSNDPMDKFNDITKWNYSKLPELFEGDFCSIQARTTEEFDKALKQANEEQKNRLCYIEIFTDMMDVPDSSYTLIDNIKNAVKDLLSCNKM